MTHWQILAAGLLSAVLMTAAPAAMAGDSMDCTYLDDFESREQLGEWRAVNDGVMGGRSSGGPDMMAEFLRFSGTINTNGGGFSSFRRGLKSGELSGATHIQIKARPDGRAYELTFRSHRRSWGRPVSYRGALEFTGEGEWKTATVVIDEMDSFVYGRSVDAPVLDRDKAETVGIILADGQDGPFQLDVAWIKVCR